MSEDDLRIGDVLRQEYRPLSQEESLQIKEVKDLGQQFLTALDRINRLSSIKARCLDLAAQRIEESVMWAVKGITVRNG